VGKTLVVIGLGLILAGILGGYFVIHNIYGQPYEKVLFINSSYAAIIPTDNGNVEVVVYQNGQLKDLGTFNGIVFNNPNALPGNNPLVDIQQLLQFDQQVVPQNPTYQYLNWSIILYFPNGQGKLPITSNGSIDLSNINLNDMALVATTNQYLIPLDEAILSQQGKLYGISASGNEYLYYNDPSIENIVTETKDLQAYSGSYWGGGGLYIVNNNNSTELIPLALTNTAGPALTPAGFYNGSS